MGTPQEIVITETGDETEIVLTINGVEVGKWSWLSDEGAAVAKLLIAHPEYNPPHEVG